MSCLVEVETVTMMNENQSCAAHLGSLAGRPVPGGSLGDHFEIVGVKAALLLGSAVWFLPEISQGHPPISQVAYAGSRRERVRLSEELDIMCERGRLARCNYIGKCHLVSRRTVTSALKFLDLCSEKVACGVLPNDDFAEMGCTNA